MREDDSDGFEVDEDVAAATDITASEVADRLYRWAALRGALTTSQAASSHEQSLESLFERQDIAPFSMLDQTLMRLRIVGVTADDKASRVAVLTRLKITGQARDHLPRTIGKNRVSFHGSIGIPQIPPIIPLSGTLGGARFYLRNDKFACGSSITASTVHGAGTFGALVRLTDGTICGLTNNHVTGDCNHTLPGMYVLCPAPMDADPSKKPPTAIGQHHSFITLNSGDPTQVARQEHDVALFRISNPADVSSCQGDFGLDTPSMIVPPAAGMVVQKVGRTTGLTRGTILGPIVTPLLIPYQSSNFRSTVHFQGAWAIRGAGGDEFSGAGDSGSLVVTEDNGAAVGLIFAGGTGISFMMSIDSVLNRVGATLVSGHNT